MNIKEIFRKTENQLLDYLSEILIKKGYDENDIQITDHYIYVKGDLPVMLVAHLDTVHSQIPINIFKDEEFNLMWSPQGLGADDRAGVYAILQLADSYKPHILFTTEEETGGFGARKATEDLSFYLEDIKFVIELDRQGKNDAVFYDCDNVDFVDYIEKYGFIKSYGSFSDISILCPIWGIAGVNLSIGYYFQHSKQEYLNVNEMEQTIDKVKDILNTLPEYGFEYIPQIYEINDEETNEEEENICSFCGIEILADEIHYEDEEIICCSNCHEEEYFYCDNCERYLENDNKSLLMGICEECLEKIMMA